MSKSYLFLKNSGKALNSKLNRYHKRKDYSNLKRSFKLISITGSSQVLVQAVGFLSGILIIRLLPVEEYAFYTLANTMLGTMSLLADGGISAGVLSKGGQHWENKNKLGAVLSTGLDLRKKFSIGSLFITLPILFYLLVHHEASWLMAVLISVSIIPAFYADLSSSLLVIVPKLHQAVPSIQKNELGVSLGRLLLTGSFIFFFPFTFIALLASGLPRIYGNFGLKKIARSYIDKEKPDREIRKEILRTVKKMFPGIIYYCFSGQITLWILSVFGNTNSLAQLGALAKFAVLLTIFHTVIGTVIVPQFARMVREVKNLSNYYALTILTLFFFLILVVIGVSLVPSQILWILGENYNNLQFELILTVIGGCLGLLAGTSYALNVSRNWVLNPVMSISISFISIVVGAFLFDVSELKGVLLFNIFLAIVQLLMHLFYGFHKLKEKPVSLLQN